MAAAVGAKAHGNARHGELGRRRHTAAARPAAGQRVRGGRIDGTGGLSAAGAQRAAPTAGRRARAGIGRTPRQRRGAPRRDHRRVNGQVRGGDHVHRGQRGAPVRPHPNKSACTSFANSPRRWPERRPPRANPSTCRCKACGGVSRRPGERGRAARGHGGWIRAQGGGGGIIPHDDLTVAGCSCRPHPYTSEPNVASSPSAPVLRLPLAAKAPLQLPEACMTSRWWRTTSASSSLRHRSWCSMHRAMRSAARARAGRAERRRRSSAAASETRHAEHDQDNETHGIPPRGSQPCILISCGARDRRECPEISVMTAISQAQFDYVESRARLGRRTPILRTRDDGHTLHNVRETHIQERPAADPENAPSK